MTQVFDAESGSVTPVTVIAAGPCPVVQVKTHDTDGYDAVQLAFDAVAERKLTRPELGHLRKGGIAPHRSSSSSAARSTAPPRARPSRSAVFAPGDKVKVSGKSHRQGLPGHDQAPQLLAGPRSHGSHNIRKPGSIGASATPSRVFKGIQMAGRMGGKRVTQVGLTIHGVDAENNLLLVKGAVPGPKNGIVEMRG